MSMKRTVVILSTAALAFAALLGVAAYSRANAQSSTPSAPSVVAPFEKNGLRSDFDRGPRGETSNEDLATALGITVDELDAAYQSAGSTALAQAVEAGLITQAQADELSTNGAAFPFGGRWGGWLAENGIDFNALLADALGISVDDLQSAQTETYDARIDQAVADGNLSQEQADLMKGRYALSNSQSFQSAMQTAFEDAVNQAVDEGVITQTQADLILQNSDRMMLPGFGGGPGGHGGRGGFDRHGGMGEPGAPVLPYSAPSGDASDT